MLRFLRFVRIASVLLICVLAGYYAGNYFWSDAPGNAPELEQPLVTTLPDFRLGDLNGDSRSILEWSDKSLLINFWATWCAPCRREMPLLQTLQDERSAENFQVIGVAVDRLPDVTAFIAESGVTYPILVGQQDAMEAAERFGPEFLGLPFSIFVAPGGDVLALHAGELHREDLRAILAIADQVAAGRLDPERARQQLTAL